MSNQQYCKMRLLIWDMEGEKWDFVVVSVPGKPGPGPSDEYLKVIGPEVQPDGNGNFTSTAYSEEEINAVHAFAVARLTIHLWEKAVGLKIIWQWNAGKRKNERPLNIQIDDTQSAGFHLVRESAVYGLYKEKRTCKSLDIVSHEITHGIIESLRPDIHYINTVQAYAVVEALADLSAILLHASIPELYLKSADKSNSDLRLKNPVSEFAEGYGKAGEGIRSALDKVSTANDSYSLAKPLVNSVYMKLVEKWEKSPSGIVGLLAWVEELTRYAFYPLLNLREISPENYFTALK